MSFAAETAAGNTETGMQISAITTDVTSGSEDFDFVLRLMAGGSAPTEALRVRPTGTALLSAILDATGGNTATVNGVTLALSSQAQAETGTDNTTQMTPLRVDQAIDAKTARLATWQAQSRFSNTDYQNTTAYPLDVSIVVISSSVTTSYLYVGQNTSSYIEVGSASMSGGWNAQLVTTVPPGWYYKWVPQSGAAISLWLERRV
jgi:hypothetical protein